ncbi:hypothetical protein L0F63_007033, partial [Massospora cicadina]
SLEMSTEDRDESFGLTADVIQARRRLFEQKLSGEGLGQDPAHRPDRPSVGRGTSGANPNANSQPAPRRGLVGNRQPEGDTGPQSLRPSQIEPAATPRAPFTAPDGPGGRGHRDQEGIRIIPRPLPGYTGGASAQLPSQPRPETACGEPGSLLSPAFMDYETQRFFILAAFVLVQGFKLADIYVSQTSTSPGGFSLDPVFRLVKWMAGDSVFLMAVRHLRVPKLTYPVSRLLLALLLLSVIDALILYRHLVVDFVVILLLPFGTYVPGYSKMAPAPITKLEAKVTELPESKPRAGELEIGLGSQKEVSREELLLESSHLLGKYIVKILPDSISKMNPDGLSFCLNQLSDHTYDGPAFIPVYINGTNPFQLRYTFIDLKGKRVATRNVVLARFARNHMVDSETKLVSGTYLLQADKPGRYVLDGIFADKEYMFRQSAEYREAVVAPCPRASFVGADAASPVPVCLGRDTVALNIEAKGIAPFLVTYTRQVNSSDNIHRANGDKPWAREGALPVEEATQLIKVDTDLQKPGLYKFRVNGIEDRFNNKATYNESEATTRFIHAHGLPTLRTSCDSAKHYYLSPKSPKARLEVEFSGDSPFSVVLGVCENPEEASSDACFVKHVSHAFHSARGYFDISTPGHFRVLAFSDNNCPAGVGGRPSCVVTRIPPPTLQIKGEPIVSACQTEIGLETTLLMTGQPPFTVSYREYAKLDSGKTRITERQVVAQNLHHYLNLMPEESGAYRYDFHTLASENYGEVNVSYTLRQVVRALPTARFASLTQAPARTCTGVPILPQLATLRLNGLAPWTLNYTIFHNDQVSERTLPDITRNDAVLPLEAMDTPGRYIIQLTRVSDGGSCHNPLDTPPLVVDVRSSRPSVEFRCRRVPNRTIYSLRNQEAALPLSLTGEGPWKVGVFYPSFHNETITLERSSDGLPARQEGTYELVSVRDSYCQGLVLEESQCRVKWHPEPTQAFPPQEGLTQAADKPHFVQAGVCQGAPASVAIELTGRPSWRLGYTHHHPLVNQLPLELTAEQANATSRFILDTVSSGLHTYTFRTVGDALYAHHSLDPPLVLEQEVFPRPAAWFTTSSPLHRCAGQELEDLEISFEGQPPFEVILEWRTAGGLPKQEHLTGIPHSPYRFSLGGLAPGSHSLRIMQVKDANGCLGGPDLSVEAARPAVLRVEVVALPSLRPASLAARRSDACVGDRLAYTLGGVSPWEVHYLVNGTLRKAAQREASFRRLIDAPGTFEVVQVCHLPGAGCCAPPPAGLGQVVIHPLPGALIAGGSDQFVHIHDGEHTKVDVTLLGTPPFQFTYTRRNVHTHELQETLTVPSVADHLYQLDVSLEGIFEVVAVRDQFCQYPVPPNLVDLDEPFP